MNKTNYRDVLAWLKSLECSSTATLSCPNFLRPYHLATLAVTYIKKGIDSVSFHDKGLASYAKRMGLHKLIGEKSTINSLGASSLVEITRISSKKDIEIGALKLAKVINDNSNIPYGCIEYLTIVMSELLDNCYHHSESKIRGYGFACAQAWKNGQLAQIAIADAGIGIRASLNENKDLQARLNLENACKLATAYAISSKLGVTVQVLRAI